jgi:hypothetical protein
MPENAAAPQKAKRFRRAEASEYLKSEWGLSYAPRTLAKMASVSSDGPPMEYDRRRPLYPQDALDEWAAGKIGPRVRSTSELPVRAPLAA